jgi:hypothetical protein
MSWQTRGAPPEMYSVSGPPTHFQPSLFATWNSSSEPFIRFVAARIMVAYHRGPGSIVRVLLRITPRSLTVLLVNVPIKVARESILIGTIYAVMFRDSARYSLPCMGLSSIHSKCASFRSQCTTAIPCRGRCLRKQSCRCHGSFVWATRGSAILYGPVRCPARRWK